MRHLLLTCATALILTLAFPFASYAQMDSGSSFHIGPRVTLSLGDISDAYGGDFALGADARYSRADFPVRGNAAFDFYFAEEDITVFTVDVNVLYPFEAGESFAPYVGAGLGYTNVSVDVETDFGSFSGDATDTGLNLVGGAEFPMGGAFTPFAQVQFTMGDLDRFGLTGGVLFQL